MAIGDVFKLTTIAEHLSGGKQAVNSWYFEQLGVLILDTPEEDLFDAFLSNVQPVLLDLFTNFISIVTVNIGKGPEYFTSFQQTVNWQGTASGDPMPAQNCPLLKYRTADVSRRGRGRLFLFAANESVNSSGAPTGAYQDAINTLGEAALVTIHDDVLTHAGWIWRMFSPADAVTKVITSYSAGTYWGSQLDRRGMY